MNQSISSVDISARRHAAKATREAGRRLIYAASRNHHSFHISLSGSIEHLTAYLCFLLIYSGITIEPNKTAINAAYGAISIPVWISSFFTSPAASAIFPPIVAGGV